MNVLGRDLQQWARLAAAFPGHEPNAKGAQEILKLADQIRWDGSTRLVTEDPPPADYSWATDLSLNLWNSVAGISP